MDRLILLCSIGESVTRIYYENQSMRNKRGLINWRTNYFVLPILDFSFLLTKRENVSLSKLIEKLMDNKLTSN